MSAAEQRPLRALSLCTWRSGASVEMQTEQQRQPPWELKVQAKAKDFDFRLKTAIKHLPSARNLSRFSISLKYCSVFIKFQGKPKAPRSRKFKIFKSKFCKILERFRIRRGSEKSTPAIANEGSACGSSSMVGNLSLLWQWISGNEERGILFLGRMIFPYLASVFKNLVPGKINIFLLVFIVTVCICSILFLLQ